MSAAITLPPGVALCHLPAPFPLARGGALPGAWLAYELHGPAGAPVVAVLGGISAGRHVCSHAAVTERGWWEEIAGADRAIDTQRYRVLAFDWLGGAGGSTAPASGEAFPFVAAEDQARALLCLCDELRIPRLHAIVGSSYGGMVALHAAAAAPERVGRICAIAAAHKSHPQASAWRAVQRAIVQLGQRTGAECSALAIARSLAMTTYRTPDELAERFADGGVAAWLHARGASFAERWSPEQFLCLVASIDAHRIDPRAVTAPAFVLAFAGDQLVPTSDVRELALRLPDLRLHRELRSRFGHDAFLKEHELVATFVREVLR